MLRIISKITITPQSGKPFEINALNEFEVSTSYEKLTDTAKIVFPRNINYEGKNIFTGTTPLFKRGDSVKIECGYDPRLRTVFNGYITKIGANLPIVIEAEDKMFLLKNTKVTYPEKTGTITTSKKGKLLKKPIITSNPITLNQLLDYMLTDTEINFKIIVNKPSGKGYANDVNLGNFRATKVSCTEILDTLKKEYGLFSYFVDDTLHVGLPSNAAQSNTEEFAFEKTIINSEDLEYQQQDDLFIKIVAISMDSNNTKKQIEVGDTDGSQRTYYTYNASDDDLKTFANSKLKEVKYTGYSGKIFTFGEPFVKHGDIAKITSEKLPERDGFYQITGVDYSMTIDGGWKQNIDVGTFIGKVVNDVNVFKQNGS